jgi:Domain of unknown function (DUF4326)
MDDVQPRVFNKRALKGPLPNSVYIGRPSKWGNPFSHKAGTLAQHRVETVDDAVKAYEAWVVQQAELMAALRQLRGKHLICWCAPGPCHGNVLLKLANAGIGE